MLLTGRLVALAALGVVAAFVSPVVLGIWASVLVLLVTVDVALAAPLARLTAERRPTAPTRLGETTAATVVVRNGSRRTARLRLRDRWVPSAGADPAVARWRLAAGETRAYREPWVPGAGVRGDLTARGWLTATSHAAERSTGFRVP